MDWATTSPVDWRPQWSWFLLLVYLGASATTRPQIDPEKRQLVPLTAILRVTGHYTFYARDDVTAPGFRLPPDHATLHVRSGLRWGGREPLMLPSLAMELSAWYDGQFRTDAEPYGFNGDREL